MRSVVSSWHSGPHNSFTSRCPPILHRSRPPLAALGLLLKPVSWGPISWGNGHANHDQQQLTDRKQKEPQRRPFSKSIRMEPNSQFVHAKPRPTRHNITRHHQSGQSSRTNQPTPACVQHQGIPQHNNECAVLLRIPTPKPSPGVIRPKSPQHGSDKAEKQGKAERAINPSG